MALITGNKLMAFIDDLKESFLHLLFPRICAGCGQELPAGPNGLCTYCLLELSETGFETQPGNPVEKNFWGRLPLRAAAATFYFQRDTLIQGLMHRFKYRSDQDLCVQLGRMAGQRLKDSGRFEADVLIPLPLFAERQRLRGYNQAELLCNGIARILDLPVMAGAVFRTLHTGTQTKRSRAERWANMEGRFELGSTRQLKGKRLLLVDDVVTTGATLEACGLELLKSGCASLSISTLCYAARI